jgi:hypothetical protein
MERNNEDKKENAAQALEYFPVPVHLRHYNPCCHQFDRQIEYRQADHQF